MSGRTSSPGCSRSHVCAFSRIAPQVAGITADANILINTCRLQAQRYLFTYQVGACQEGRCDGEKGGQAGGGPGCGPLGHIACPAVSLAPSQRQCLACTCLCAPTRTPQEPIPVDQLVRGLCDTKQGYTQYGGLRPFGVSLLYAGWCARAAGR